MKKKSIFQKYLPFELIYYSLAGIFIACAFLSIFLNNKYLILYAGIFSYLILGIVVFLMPGLLLDAASKRDLYFATKHKHKMRIYAWELRLGGIILVSAAGGISYFYQEQMVILVAFVNKFI